jgi:hypothetical protein
MIADIAALSCWKIASAFRNRFNEASPVDFTVAAGIA